MEALFYRVAVVSAAVSAVLLPLLLLLPRWRKRYAPHTRRAVWLVITVVLLAVPLLPKSRSPVQITVPERTITIPVAPIEVPDQSANTTVQVSGEMAIQSPAPKEDKPQTVAWGVILSGLWLIGGAAVLLWQSVVYLLARRRLMSRAVFVDGCAELAAEVCPGRKVRFFRVAGLDTPMTLGVLRPVVLLPEREVRSAALRHELIHIRRGDVAWKWLILLACATHWFNPLVWVMSRRSDQDMEASCDAIVVADGDAAFRRAYGELLLETAGARRVPVTTQFGGGKKMMKERLYDLFHPGKKSRLFVGVVLLICLLAGGLVACEKEADPQLDTPQLEGTVADGVYCAPMPGSVETEGEYDPEQWTFTLMEYDPDAGEIGTVLGKTTLPLAKELMIRRLEDSEFTDLSKLTPEKRRKRIFAFIHWPMLRAAIYPGKADLLEVRVQGGEVTALAWFQVPSATGMMAEGIDAPEAVLTGAENFVADRAILFSETVAACDQWSLDSLEWKYQHSDGEELLEVYQVTWRLHTSVDHKELREWDHPVPDKDGWYEPQSAYLYFTQDGEYRFETDSEKKGDDSTTEKINIGKAVKVILRSGLTGDDAEITDADTIAKITGEFENISFVQSGSGEDYVGYAYMLRWLDANGNKLLELSVQGSDRIKYNGFFYDVVEGKSIDTEYLESLLH